MKSFRNLNLVLAALALCAFAAPGKAQGSRDSTPQTLVCTSYPEWSCELQSVSVQEATSATTPQMDGPNCTSYPEWSCEPQTVSGNAKTLAKKQHDKKGSKRRAGLMAQERKSSRKVSGATGDLDETFERRPE